MVRPQIVKNEIYHVLNRGVDKRNIFLDEEDYLRFIHDLFEFNDIAPALNLAYHIGLHNPKEVGLPKIERRPRELLVEILIFCLMKNHFHLLVRPKNDTALTAFMRKLGTGYTNYFNKKYERSGALFQGKYKVVHVNQETHFIHLPYYIHCNPLDYFEPSWRERKIKDHKRALEYLENYRWSSFPDYLGKKNFPSVTQRDFISKFYHGPKEYKKAMFSWLQGMDLNEIKDRLLE